MGLGAFPAVSLADARKARDEAERLVREGRDPIAARDDDRLALAKKPTFGEAAADLIASKSGEWRNAKHRAQWTSTLETYCATIWSKHVDEIDTGAVLSVLQPVWTTKPETASRLRGRIEAVIDAARARGHISTGAANPARWRGHLQALLPRRAKLSRGHHAALPYAQLPAFLTRLRQADGFGARALEFAVLTAARSGEVLGAMWNEIDLKAKVWTIPAARMKAGREHRVPLSAPALAILEAMAKVRSGDFVFPGRRSGQPLGATAIRDAMQSLKVGDATPHGFRSTFRDWCGEETDFARELAEAALAHVVGDAAEQAYRRGDAIEKRRALMDAWATLCGGGK